MNPLRTLLIANRGEIAVRIQRTARAMGLRTVAVFSDADRDAPFVHNADVAVHIGPAPSRESYLSIERIIAAARRAGADAIHPGYGFLSENAALARACREAGVAFVGPPPEAIERMGSKITAKELMAQRGVPVIPGVSGADLTPKKLAEAARAIGYPVLIKASAGGGGKGMKIVSRAADFDAALESARREAAASFGDDAVLVEKYISAARHVEIQIMGDMHGHLIHLGERECSIQRRHQKVIEETPSVIITPERREKMGAAAVEAGKAIGYQSAGTVEFVVDGENPDHFYFLEVNTRLQVEHPVTEMVLGLDLVRLQIEIAQGHRLALRQQDISPNGHAVEARLCAEDPAGDFMPATGTIHLWRTTGEEHGVRWDAGVQNGSEISPYYDSMIAKVIAHAPTRAEAIAKLDRALARGVCLGPTTNQDFLRLLLANPEFNGGQFDTGLIGRAYPDAAKRAPSLDADAQAALAMVATLHLWHQRQGQRAAFSQLPSGWRNNAFKPQRETLRLGGHEIAVDYRALESWPTGAQRRFEITVGGKNYDVRLAGCEGSDLALEINGLRTAFTLHASGETVWVHSAEWGTHRLEIVPRWPQAHHEEVRGGCQSPVPGTLRKILVKVGDRVKSGDGLVVMESMKMETTLTAHADGIVREIFSSEGEFVQADTLIVRVEEDE